jgi:hypothetical protein
MVVILDDYYQAVAALQLELPSAVFDDFKAKSDALLARLAEAEKRANDNFTAGASSDVEAVMWRRRAEADRDRETAVVKQLSTILGTIRPLDVMGPDEDLSIGECADRWEERVREMVADSAARAAVDPEQQP